MTVRRLLAVSHEATLTGAPMNLLHLVRWLAEHTDVQVEVLVLTDGPLRHRFEEVATVHVLDQGPLLATTAAVQAGLRALGSRRAWRPIAAARLRPQLRRLDGFDIVYLNSLASLSVLPHLPPARRVVSHVHELQVALRTQRAEEQELLREAPDAWVAASGAVRDLLVAEVGLPEDRVLLHHEFIDTVPFRGLRSDPRELGRRRRELDLHPETAVVMGAGTIDWRKGTELFIQLATEVRRRTRHPVRFLWVGGDLTGVDAERLHSDLARAGADNVTFLGTKPDPRPWFELADVFALTSHEDPFPLVCLEHAAMGHPLVTYRNGGMPELLEAAGPDARRGIADFLDVGSLAARTIAFLDDDELHRRAGAQLREHVLAHHDVTVAAPRLLADLERVTERPARS
ncbi:MAG: glycosyltransferase family 4 protein [Microthrixaceae bacterium]